MLKKGSKRINQFYAQVQYSSKVFQQFLNHVSVQQVLVTGGLTRSWDLSRAVSLEAICWKPAPLPCSPHGQSSFTTDARSQYWTLPFGIYLTSLKHIDNRRFSAPKLIPSHKVIFTIDVPVGVPIVSNFSSPQKGGWKSWQCVYIYISIYISVWVPSVSGRNIIAPKLKTSPAFQNGVSVHWALGIFVAETTKAMKDLWYTTRSGVSHCCWQQATISSEH